MSQGFLHSISCAVVVIFTLEPGHYVTGPVPNWQRRTEHTVTVGVSLPAPDSAQRHIPGPLPPGAGGGDGGVSYVQGTVEGGGTHAAGKCRPAGRLVPHVVRSSQQARDISLSSLLKHGNGGSEASLRCRAVQETAQIQKTPKATFLALLTF